MRDSEISLLTSKIIEAAIAVHNQLGPGLLESVYSAAMQMELRLMDMHAESEVRVPVIYRGNKITDEGFRLDLVVEDTVIVELKSVDVIQPVHKKQLLTYLRLANKPLGLLINFNNRLLKEGIVRIVNSPKGDDS